jgi:hypothetical protein
MLLFCVSSQLFALKYGIMISGADKRTILE